MNENNKNLVKPSLEIEDYVDYSKNVREVDRLKKTVKSYYRSTYWWGIFLIITLLGGFGAWLVLAKIDRATVAVGEIIPGGNNKVVQHLEGGIIEKLNVREGATVNEGDVLIILSKTSASANREIVEGSLDAAVAEYSRLVAERDFATKVTYPSAWYNNPKFAEFMKSQNTIFFERQKAVRGKISILEERNNQLQSEIRGIRSQITSAEEQLRFNNQEMQTAQNLLASGNTTMTRVLGLKSRKAEIEGRIGELRSSVSRAEQTISENKLSMVNVRNEILNEVVEKIKEVQAKINELKERSTAASDTLNRTEIIAPISGIIKDLKFKTESGVIPPGAEIMTIVPLGDDLIAEVHIPPIDRDVVYPGLEARIRLSSYSARHVPMMPGKLTYVSPDIFKDPQTQQAHYKGRVDIDLTDLPQYLHGNHEQLLYPGMPVEVYITTGARSPLQYLIEPVTNTFRKSFREE
ncbi:MAG: HlyD family type I secretion periplasmic adaptor subunit [Rickettsiales bacterium]|nr:HlyD family type I secretion periplasmic adaptor subunit [Rickettsiales bacterium]